MLRQEGVPPARQDRTLVPRQFPGREVSVDERVAAHRLVQFGIVALVVDADESLQRLERLHVVPYHIVRKVVLVC